MNPITDVSAVTAGGQPTLLPITGPMTLYEAPAIKASLLAALASADAIEIDLQAVDEMDTAGVQLLLMAVREGGRNGKHVACVRASPAVLEVLRLYGLAHMAADPASQFQGGQA